MELALSLLFFPLSLATGPVSQIFVKDSSHPQHDIFCKKIADVNSEISCAVSATGIGEMFVFDNRTRCNLCSFCSTDGGALLLPILDFV